MDAVVVSDRMPITETEEPEITSAPPSGPAAPEEPTASDSFTGQRFEQETGDSCPWSHDCSTQVLKLKFNWRRVLRWSGVKWTRVEWSNFETHPWFVSTVLRLRNAPCLGSFEVEIDESLLGILVSGSKMTSLNLAILMDDSKMVEEILENCPAPNDEIHRPLVDQQRCFEFEIFAPPDVKINFLFTPLHLAVTDSEYFIFRALLEKGADVTAPNWLLETPVHLAAKRKREYPMGLDLVLILLEYATKKDRTLPKGTVDGVKLNKKMTLHDLAANRYHEVDCTDALRYLVTTVNVDINALDKDGLSAFYVAVLCCNTEFVNALLVIFKGQIRLNEECVSHLGPPIQIAEEGGKDFKDIERALMECDSVKGYMDTLYRDRQVYVDAANAILVGAALIASVTFASWLQPPLNYTSYSGEGYSSSLPAPATSDLSYVDVEHNIPLRAFWIFNALSFYFAIGSVVCGARSVLPRSHLFIKKTVEKLRKNLLVTSFLLACSMLCVIIAFAIAGTIVLTPLLKYQWYMIVPTLVGGVVCISSLVFLVKSMWEIFSDIYEKNDRSNSKRIDYLEKSQYIEYF